MGWVLGGALLGERLMFEGKDGGKTLSLNSFKYIFLMAMWAF